MGQFIELPNSNLIAFTYKTQLEQNLHEQQLLKEGYTPKNKYHAIPFIEPHPLLRVYEKPVTLSKGEIVHG